MYCIASSVLHSSSPPVNEKARAAPTPHRTARTRQRRPGSRALAFRAPFGETPSRMHAVHVLQALDYADPANVGGASRVALAIGKELAATGWHVTFFAGCQGKRGVYDHDGLTFYHFPSRLSEEQSMASNVRLVWRASRMARRVHIPSPGLLFCHQPFVTWALRHQVAAVPLVYYFHSPWAEEYGVRRAPWRIDATAQRAIRVGLERWALRRASLILVASEFMRQQLARFHPEASIGAKVETLPHGVDTDFFRPHGAKPELRRKLGLPVGRPLVITARRLEDRMGLEELLGAIDLCRRTLTDIFLLVVGRGRLEERLRSMANELGLAEHVRFWGYARDDELPELYSAADLFVLPTQALEGFGLVILEASACGLPVVATPVGAIPEIVGRMDTDLLAGGTDARALAERMTEVLRREAADPTRGTRYRDFVLENYSWKKCAREFAAKAERVVGKDFTRLDAGTGNDPQVRHKYRSPGGSYRECS
jgi:glycosyltransferase involved in cell wall biosynthesis